MEPLNDSPLPAWYAPGHQLPAYLQPCEDPFQAALLAQGNANVALEPHAANKRLRELLACNPGVIQGVPIYQDESKVQYQRAGVSCGKARNQSAPSKVMKEESKRKRAANAEASRRKYCKIGEYASARVACLRAHIKLLMSLSSLKRQCEKKRRSHTSPAHI